ncbi:MAG: hypothetical protein R6V85_16090 [Polyangia bacterium]
MRLVSILLLLPLAACSSKEESEVEPDGGSDTDTDTDTDADTDTDTDTGTETGTGSDTFPEDYQVIDVATGRSHTCAVLDGGGIKCWGSNQFGPLGYPVDEQVCGGSTPDTCPFVDLGEPAVQVEAGGYHTCALLESGAVKCWGYDLGPGSICHGVLGPGIEVPPCGWVDDPSGTGVLSLQGSIAAISATDCHTSALKSSGKVRTWGCAYQPQLSQSEVTPDNRLIDFGGAAVQISTGEDHHCVLVEGGDVYCWGLNEQGQLGYGHTDFVAAAQVPDQAGPVELGGPAVQVAAGGQHSCALLENGEVVCWGQGAGGQLGYGNTENVGDDELPMEAGTVEIGGAATRISAGTFNTCAVRGDGSLVCWGANSGVPLGYGTDELIIGDDETPASVGPLDVAGTVADISVGYVHLCATMASGRIRCWGENESGQLGYGGDEDVGDDETPASAGDVPLM